MVTQRWRSPTVSGCWRVIPFVCNPVWSYRTITLNRMQFNAFYLCFPSFLKIVWFLNIVTECSWLMFILNKVCPPTFINICLLICSISTDFCLFFTLAYNVIFVFFTIKLLLIHRGRARLSAIPANHRKQYPDVYISNDDFRDTPEW